MSDTPPSPPSWGDDDVISVVHAPLPIVATPTQVKSLLRENVCADAADAARLMLVLPLLAIPELKLLLACS